jgi:hypothetical protein
VAVSRKSIRNGIAQYFGGMTLSDGWYRPTLLDTAGLAGVRAYYDDRIKDNEYFTGLDAGTRTGALMCVHLDDDSETRLEIGGVLDRPFLVQLYLFLLTRAPSPEAAQADRDDLVEAVRGMVRTDPTLGMGVNSAAPLKVTQAGEGSAGIRTSTPLPYFEPPATTRQNAVISFTASTYPAG